MNERKQFDPAPLLPASDDWIAREEGNRLVYILRERNGQSALDILVRADYEDFGITRGHLEAIIEELGCPIDSELASANVAEKVSQLGESLKSLMYSQAVEECAKSGVWRSEPPDEIKAVLRTLNETVDLIRMTAR